MGADYLSFNAGKSLPRGQAVVQVKCNPQGFVRLGYHSLKG